MPESLLHGLGTGAAAAVGLRRETLKYENWTGGAGAQICGLELGPCSRPAGHRGDPVDLSDPSQALSSHPTQWMEFGIRHSSTGKLKDPALDIGRYSKMMDFHEGI